MQTNMTKLIVAFCNFVNMLKKSSVHASCDLLVHSTECKYVCDTNLAQHFISIYSAMQHTSFLQPPSQAHHIYITQCKLNLMSLYTENCKTKITERGPFTVNANMLVTCINLLHHASTSFKCPSKLQNFWVTTFWKMFREAQTSWHIVSPHFPVKHDV